MNAPEKLTVRIKLPSASGKLEEFRLSAPRDFGTAGRKTFNRIALAAAHVVADPLALGNPWLDAAVDWDATTAYRHYLWSLGLGVAERSEERRVGKECRAALGRAPRRNYPGRRSRDWSRDRARSSSCAA